MTAIFVCLALIANLGAWIGYRSPVPMGPFERAFQMAPPYLAYKLKGALQRERSRFTDFAKSSCPADEPCSIIIIGFHSHTLADLFPFALLNKKAKFIDVLLEPEVVPRPYCMGAINTAFFNEDQRIPLPDDIDYSDMAQVAGVLERQAKLLKWAQAPHQPLEVLKQAFAGLRYAGRWERLDYYTAEKAAEDFHGPPP